jgi:hypothetical protein
VEAQGYYRCPSFARYLGCTHGRRFRLDHRPLRELQPISGLNLEYWKALERVSDCSAEDWLQDLVAREKRELAGVGANSVQ